MVMRFPGRWKTRASSFGPASAEQALAMSSVLAVIKGWRVRTVSFVEFREDGTARLVVDFGGRA